ncbi:hypothetical protein LJC18_05395 [Lachnospiraceae bacterium OttesenSCG-928-E19]|nr:hypothetical protein [Lachnospiraceae bacterium OttesenSCG-928-E19]
MKIILSFVFCGPSLDIFSPVLDINHISYDMPIDRVKMKNDINEQLKKHAGGIKIGKQWNEHGSTEWYDKTFYFGQPVSIQEIEDKDTIVGMLNRKVNHIVRNRTNKYNTTMSMKPMDSVFNRETLQRVYPTIDRGIKKPTIDQVLNMHIKYFTK